jgi:hypothetical protein
MPGMARTQLAAQATSFKDTCNQPNLIQKEDMAKNRALSKGLPLKDKVKKIVFGSGTLLMSPLVKLPLHGGNKGSGDLIHARQCSTQAYTLQARTVAVYHTDQHISDDSGGSASASALCCDKMRHHKSCLVAAGSRVIGESEVEEWLRERECRWRNKPQQINKSRFPPVFQPVLQTQPAPKKSTWLPKLIRGLASPITHRLKTELTFKVWAEQEHWVC